MCIGGHGPFLRSGTPLQFSETKERTRYISKSGTDQITNAPLMFRSSVNVVHAELRAQRSLNTVKIKAGLTNVQDVQLRTKPHH